MGARVVGIPARIFRYKSASFFDVPPEGFSREYRALLAGTGEFLSKEFGLTVPAWTEEAQYFLEEWWDALGRVPLAGAGARGRAQSEGGTGIPASKDHLRDAKPLITL